jgi:hypothetical protein
MPNAVAELAARPEPGAIGRHWSRNFARLTS